MKIVHTATASLAAKKFVEPLVQSDTRFLLCQDSELWVPLDSKHTRVFEGLAVSKRNIKINLSRNIFKSLWRVYKLFRMLRKSKPDLLIAHFSRGALLPLLASFCARTPCRIYFNHGLPYLGYTGLVRWLLVSLERLNCLFAHQIFTVNNALVLHLKALGTNQPIYVLGTGSACGIENNYFQSSAFEKIASNRRDLGIGKECFIFLYVGRPVTRKGFLKTFDAFIQLKNNNPNIKAKLIMAGITKDDLMAAGREVSQDVLALGYRSDMESLYEMAQVVVLPSLHEGLPYCLLEGGAKKCAWIVSRLPGLEEIVVEGATGFFIDPHNVQQLSDIMLFAATHPDKIKEMGDHCFQKTKAFKRDDILREYTAIIENIVLNLQHTEALE